MTDLSQAPRLVIDAELAPITGSIFQPTGFPDLGAATFQRPGGPPALLVESVQSLTNHLEAVGWDEMTALPVATLAALPYARVVDRDGVHLASSRTEPHRLASAYVRDAEIAGQRGRDWIVGRLGLVKGRPLDWGSIYAALFELDPLCLLHGVLFRWEGKDQIHGNPKVRRAITASIEAEDVAPAISGGVKRDDVWVTTDEAGRTAKAGYGFVPFGRTDFTARRIAMRIVVDLGQISGYGLGADRTALLRDVALWEVADLLAGPLRLRSMCDLEVLSVDVQRPDGAALPEVDELAERIATSRVGFEAAEPWTLVFGAA